MAPTRSTGRPRKRLFARTHAYFWKEKHPWKQQHSGISQPVSAQG